MSLSRRSTLQGALAGAALAFSSPPVMEPGKVRCSNGSSHTEEGKNQAVSLQVGICKMEHG